MYQTDVNLQNNKKLLQLNSKGILITWFQNKLRTLVDSSEETLKMANIIKLVVHEEILTQ